MLLDERRKITQDRTNLRLGKPPEHEWDFPDDGGSAETKEDGPLSPASRPTSPSS